VVKRRRAGDALVTESARKVELVGALKAGHRGGRQGVGRGWYEGAAWCEYSLSFGTLRNENEPRPCINAAGLYLHLRVNGLSGARESDRGHIDPQRKPTTARGIPSTTRPPSAFTYGDPHSLLLRRSAGPGEPRSSTDRASSSGALPPKGSPPGGGGGRSRGGERQRRGGGGEGATGAGGAVPPVHRHPPGPFEP